MDPVAALVADLAVQRDLVPRCRRPCPVPGLPRPGHAGRHRGSLIPSSPSSSQDNSRGIPMRTSSIGQSTTLPVTLGPSASSTMATTYGSVPLNFGWVARRAIVYVCSVARPDAGSQSRVEEPHVVHVGFG